MTLSVLDAARENPDGVALVVGEEETTWAELGSRIAARIEQLSTLGVSRTPSSLVAVVGTSHPATLEVVLALVELGQPMALIHPRLTEAERVPVIEAAAPRLVIGNAAELTSHDRAKFAPTPHLKSQIVDPEACLAVLFTSGTTGRPKGISLSRRAFSASATASEKNLGWRSDDRWLLGLPIAHVGGLSILTRCLLARRAVVVPSAVAAGQRLDVDALIHAIESARVTIASLVPTQLEWLLSQRPDWTPPAHWRVVLLGGAAARPALLERAVERGYPVLTTYGLTEACSQVTTQRLGTVNRGELGVGPPIDGIELRVVDGAIHVRGPTLLTAYVPAETRALDDDGWFRTDDLGRFDEAGNLHVLGRRTDLIVTGGENVYPAEVEAVLERCPGVSGACVFGVPDDTWGEVVVVALTASDPKTAPTDATLEAFVRANLAAHRRPRCVANLGAFATTPAGKLDRKETARTAQAVLRRLKS